MAQKLGCCSLLQCCIHDERSASTVQHPCISAESLALGMLGDTLGEKPGKRGAGSGTVAHARLYPLFPACLAPYLSPTGSSYKAGKEIHRPLLSIGSLSQFLCISCRVLDHTHTIACRATSVGMAAHCNAAGYRIRQYLDRRTAWLKGQLNTEPLKTRAKLMSLCVIWKVLPLNGFSPANILGGLRQDIFLKITLSF